MPPLLLQMVEEQQGGTMRQFGTPETRASEFLESPLGKEIIEDAVGRHSGNIRQGTMATQYDVEDLAALHLWWFLVEAYRQGLTGGELAMISRARSRVNRAIVEYYSEERTRAPKVDHLAKGRENLVADTVPKYLAERHRNSNGVIHPEVMVALAEVATNGDAEVAATWLARARAPRQAAVMYRERMTKDARMLAERISLALRNWEGTKVKAQQLPKAAKGLVKFLNRSSTKDGGPRSRS